MVLPLNLNGLRAALVAKNRKLRVRQRCIGLRPQMIVLAVDVLYEARFNGLVYGRLRDSVQHEHVKGAQTFWV
jgi:hypothetical protein